jgi:hypothetical protein
MQRSFTGAVEVVKTSKYQNHKATLISSFNESDTGTSH